MRNSYHGRSFGAIGVTGNRGWKSTSLSPLNVHFLHGADRHLPRSRGLSDAELHRRLRGRPARRARHRDRRRRRPPDRRADPGRRRLHHARRTGCSPRTRRSSTSTASCSSPTRCRPAGAAPASTSGASRRTASRPDMMTFAKGLGNGFAIGGVVARGDLMDGAAARIGISTFGGNPIVDGGGATRPSTTCSTTTCRPTPRASADRSSAGCARRPREPAPWSATVRGKGLMFAVELVDPATDAAQPAAGRRAAGGDQGARPAGRQGRPVRQHAADGPAADPHRGRGPRGPGHPHRRAHRGGRGGRSDRD